MSEVTSLTRSYLDVLAVLVEASGEGDVVRVRELLDKLAISAALNVNFDIALISSVRRGHVAVVKVLLDAGACVAAVDADGTSVLAVAEAIGRVDIVKLLVDHNADINSTTGPEGATVVMRAAARGDEDMLGYLVEAKASLSKKDANDWDALDWAMEKNQTAMARTLMHKYGMSAPRSTNGCATMIEKVIAGDILGVRTLVAAGVDVNAVDELGLPALAYAAVKGRQDIVQTLLDAQAAPIAASRGLRALSRRLYTQGDVLKALLHADRPSGRHMPPNNGMSTLHWAAKHGYADVVKLMLSVGAQFDQNEPSRCSALRYASEHGHLAVVDMLLAAGVLVDEVDRYDTTPLMVASEKGHVAVVKRLIAARAHVDKGLERSPALYNAVRRGHAEVVAVLLAAGASTTMSFGNGPLLRLASARWDVAVVNVLLAAGVIVDEKDRDGESALHVASANGCVDVVQALLGAGAVVDLGDGQGRSALHLACVRGKVAAAKALLAAGARVDEVDEAGMPLLAHAAMSGHRDIVQLLMDARAAPIAASEGLAALAKYMGVDDGNLVEGLLCVRSHDCDEAEEDEDEDEDENLLTLEWAAAHGYSDVVKLLLSHFDLSVGSGEREHLLSALNHACANGHAGVVSLLLAAGANKCGCDRSCRSECIRPLQLACRNNHALVAKTLLASRGYQIVDAAKELHRALCKGHAAVAKVLLAAGVDVMTPVDSMLPLSVAAENGHVAVVEVLLAARANVNAVNGCGWSALFFACCNGHAAVVQVLFGAGARVGVDSAGLDAFAYATACGHAAVVALQVGTNVATAPAHNSTTPPLAVSTGSEEFSVWWQLTWAAKNGCIDMVKLLLSLVPSHNWAYYAKEALIVASRVGRIAVVDMLLDAGVAADAGKKSDETPLYFACRNGHAAVVKRLLAAGVQVNCPHGSGFNPLYFATDSGHADVVKVLLSAGASIWHNSKHSNPSHVHNAVGVNNTDVVEAFLDAPTASDAQVTYQNMTLHMYVWRLAAEYGRTEVLQLLLDRNIDIEVRYEYDRTALHIATLNEQSRAVRKLLAAGVQVNSKDNVCDTALHYAAKNKNNKIAKMLLDAGACVDEVNKLGLSALAYSNVKGDRTAVDLLLAAKATPMVATPRLCELLVELQLADSLPQVVEDGVMETLFDLKHKCSLDRLSKGVHWAAQCGYADVIALLLQAGANVNIAHQMDVVDDDVEWTEPEDEDKDEDEDEDDDDRAGNREWKDELEEYELNAKMRDVCGTTPLYEACVRGHTAVVKVLVDVSACTNTRYNGHTALRAAASKGYLAIVKLLLAADADVNMKCKDGFTALHRAVKRGHVAVVRALLDARADTTIKAGRGRWNDLNCTALDLASGQGRVEMMQMLLVSLRSRSYVSEMIENDALKIAVKANKVAVVKMLLAAGVGRELWTLSSVLCDAVERGHTAVVDMLVETLMRRDAHTQSRILEYVNDMAVMEVLLKAGVRDIADEHGVTFLHHAAKFKAPYMITRLCTYALKGL